MPTIRTFRWSNRRVARLEQQKTGETYWRQRVSAAGGPRVPADRGNPRFRYYTRRMRMRVQLKPPSSAQTARKASGATAKNQAAERCDRYLGSAVARRRGALRRRSSGTALQRDSSRRRFFGCARQRHGSRIDIQQRTGASPFSVLDLCHQPHAIVLWCRGADCARVRAATGEAARSAEEAVHVDIRGRRLLPPAVRLEAERANRGRGARHLQ